MNIPKSTAEILAAAQTKQKRSRPKKTVPFAGQMSTFSGTTIQSTSKTEQLNNPFPVIPTESGSSPLQFKRIATPLSFFPEQEPEDEVETLFAISISTYTMLNTNYIYSGNIIIKQKAMMQMSAP